ncbi:hypothetical protein FZEAL_47 [Fusarium zealandicum]|uniref:Heterokaryon incompatibility domain-containing protein n=1 Tax=Fusarium zealandicum TaxID=1053134 RepID=A0A8H4UW13_9HYPO|nr:hypothetical protein FZEAL_47 [Fusarium zealandicum]
MPREGLAPEDDMARLTPFLSHIQHPGWQLFSQEHKSNAAIFMGVEFPTVNSNYNLSMIPGEAATQLAAMTGEAIALVSHQVCPNRTMGNAHLVSPMIDFESIKHRLTFCDEKHNGRCKALFAKEILTTRMIDVERRIVVSCPPNCEYIALSYVWGGVIPIQRALELRQLPPTIEDAITVTKKLGMRYLWVDALCIDQSPSPSPEQLAIKQQQLKMMDLIYASAYLTLVALSGTSSNSGLPGVSSFPRSRQVEEIIDGHIFISVPPAHAAEHEDPIWRRRAWTFQEAIFSRRSVYFTDHSFFFHCPEAYLPEALDIKTAYSRPNRNDSKNLDAAKSGIILGYRFLAEEYTRRDMTRDEDSLNAFMGILSGFQRHNLLSGFVFGLPLEHYPESLGWMHDFQATVRRRAGFPTWSWVGWAGAMSIPEQLFSPREHRRQLDTLTDMKPRFVSLAGNCLVVEGWVVQLDVLTEPFSEVLHPRTGETLGSIKEGNHIHNNTIASGKYSALITERVKYFLTKDGPEKQRTFMVLLDWQGDKAQRKTAVTFAPFSQHDVLDLKPERRAISLI